MEGKVDFTKKLPRDVLQQIALYLIKLKNPLLSDSLLFLEDFSTFSAINKTSKDAVDEARKSIPKFIPTLIPKSIPDLIEECGFELTKEAKDSYLNGFENDQTEFFHLVRDCNIRRMPVYSSKQTLYAFLQSAIEKLENLTELKKTNAVILHLLAELYFLYSHQQSVDPNSTLLTLEKVKIQKKTLDYCTMAYQLGNKTTLFLRYLSYASPLVGNVIIEMLETLFSNEKNCKQNIILMNSRFFLINFSKSKKILDLLGKQRKKLLVSSATTLSALCQGKYGERICKEMDINDLIKYSRHEGSSFGIKGVHTFFQDIVSALQPSILKCICDAEEKMVGQIIQVADYLLDNLETELIKSDLHHYIMYLITESRNSSIILNQFKPDVLLNIYRKNPLGLGLICSPEGLVIINHLLENFNEESFADELNNMILHEKRQISPTKYPAASFDFSPKRQKTTHEGENASSQEKEPPNGETLGPP